MVIQPGAFQSSVVFIPAFAVNLFGVTSSKASFMLLPVVLASAIGSPVSGKMLDKLGSRVIVIAGLLAAALAIFSLSMTRTSIIHFYTTGALLGLGVSMLMGPPLRYIMLNEVPPQERALTQGLLTVFIAIGPIAGSAIISVIIASGTNMIQGYRTAFFSLSLLMIFVMLFSFYLKNRQMELDTIQNSELSIKAE